jgi:FixJ family two-component response regulator
MSAYTNHGRTTPAKSNRERNSTLTERDRRVLRRIVSKNHRNISAQLTAEPIIHLENTVSTKTVRCELHKSNIHGRAPTAEHLITESIA